LIPAPATGAIAFPVSLLGSSPDPEISEPVRRLKRDSTPGPIVVVSSLSEPCG
jgi:hypothetical protein